MKSRTRPPEEWQAKLGTTNFDPLEAIDLVDAVKARKKRAKIGDRMFTLNYEATRVYYSPVDGFAPSGWLELERIEKGY